MATRMQQRRGTAAQWISTNSGNGPILNVGEIGFETDTNKFKIGDGTNHWVDLDYFINANSTTNPAFGSSITFEGATADDFETTLQITDPTADRTITLPDANGTLALTSDVTTAVANLVDGAPAALDTLNELAAALNDDQNFSTTVTTTLGLKASTEYVDTEIQDLNTEITNSLNLKAAITYVDSEIATETAAAVSTHSQDTTDVHGITDTTVLVTLNGTQTIANKTLNDPTIVIDPSGTNISISGEELSYLNNVSSNIQTQLNDKAATADIAVAAQDAVGGSIGTGLAYDTGTNVLSVDETAIQVRVTDVSDTEIGYLNGVTSGIQSQIDGKQEVVANVTSTEIGYLDGVTSGIQAQINDKAPLASPTFTGTVTLPSETIATTQTAGNNSTAIATTAYADAAVAALVDSAPAALNTLDELAAALGDDANFATTTATSIGLRAPIESPTFTGTVTIPSGASISGFAPLADPTFTGTVSGVTKAHVGLDNVDNTSDANKPVSSATQTALDAKANSLVTINNQTASYTLVLADAEKMVEMNVGSANTLTVPTNASVAYGVGTRLHIVQIGSGQTTITPGAGVTVNGTPGLKTRAQYSAVTLVKRAENTWIAFGDLTA